MVVHIKTLDSLQIMGNSSSSEGKGMSDCSLAAIIIVSVLVIGLIVFLIVNATQCNKDKTVDVVVQKNGGAVAAARRARLMHQQRPQQPGQSTAQSPRAVRPHPGMRLSAAQGSFTTYDAPAPMPQTQLMQPPALPSEDAFLPGVPSSPQTIGEAQFDIMTTEQGGTAINPFKETNYVQDPGMMTPSSATDIRGLQTFMPNMSGGVGGEQQDGQMGGAVDPNTGLPLFTTGKLIRSQLLGGHGAGSFLRQVQDPLTGYRKAVGKNLCGVQQTRRDLEVRRKQLNAARLASEDADPLLFYMSDFSYN
jgi:hypothetical protein